MQNNNENNNGIDIYCSDMSVHFPINLSEYISVEIRTNQ